MKTMNEGRYYLIDVDKLHEMLTIAVILAYFAESSAISFFIVFQ